MKLLQASCNLGLTAYERGTMKYLAISDFKEWDLAQALSKRHKMGFESQLFTKNENLNNSEVMEAFSLSSEIQYHSYHGPFRNLNHLSKNSEVRDDALSHYNRFYDLVKEFGATHVVFHSSYVPGDLCDEEWLQRSTVFWEEFLQDKDSSIEIHIENVYEPSYLALGTLIDRIDKEHVKICLDMGHANMSSALPVEKWIEGLAHRIGSVHMHNNDGTGDQHLGLANGTISMKHSLDLLNELAPNAVWVLETREKEASIQWLVDHKFL